MIISEPNSTYYYGRFCAKNFVVNSYNVGKQADGSRWGHSLVLQMR